MHRALTLTKSSSYQLQYSVDNQAADTRVPGYPNLVP
jgi:hypothetical protein